MEDAVFQYKYVLLDEDGSIQWENGINRIADLNILPHYDTPLEKPKLGIHPPEKQVLLNDQWEQHKIRFTVFDPWYEPGDELWLKPSINSGFKKTQMTRTQQPENWLKSKYGHSLQLWECVLNLKNQNGGKDGQFKQDSNTNFTYTYVK